MKPLNLLFRLFRAILFALLIVGVCLTTLLFLFPESSLQFILAEALKSAGITEAAFDIHTVGRESAEFGDVRLGAASNALRIQGTRLDYRPLGLLKRRLDRIRMEGLVLTLSYVHGGWKVSGLPDELLKSVGGNEGRSSLDVAELELLNSTIHVDADVPALRGTLTTPRILYRQDTRSVIVDPITIHVVGGVVVAGRSRLLLDAPALDLSLDAHGLDVSEVLKLWPEAPCTATGSLDGALRVFWDPANAPKISGRLASPEGTKGRIQFSDPKAVTRLMPSGDKRIQVVEESLKDLEYEKLQFTVNVEDARISTAAFHISGRSAKNSKLPPVRLNITFEAETKDLVYLGRLYQKLVSLNNGP